MADGIGQLLGNVSLGTDGGDVAVLDEVDSLGTPVPSGLCLIGRMIMKRPVNLKAMKSVLSRVWQLTHTLDVQEAGEWTWVFQFGAHRDMMKVLLW